MTDKFFQEAINLPLFCKINNIDHKFKFKRLPEFGWFAYTPEYTEIYNIFELVSDSLKSSLFQYCSKNHPELIDISFSNSQTNEKRLINSVNETTAFNALWRVSRQAVINQKLFFRGTLRSIASIYKTSGFSNVSREVGLITEDIQKQFSSIVPKKFINKIIIPSYHTPKHISGLYVLSPDTLEIKDTVWKRGEGWFGRFENNMIVQDIRSVLTSPSRTWHRFADYWNNQTLTIDTNYDTKMLIQLWNESSHTEFDRKICQYFHNVEELKQHVHLFSHQQIDEIKNILNIDLKPLWRNTVSKEFFIGRNKINQKDECYFVNDVEMTNFVIVVQSVFKNEDGRYARSCLLCAKGKQIPFVIPDEQCETPKKILKVIKPLFLDNNIGMPFLNPTFRYLLPVVIDRFNFSD